MSDSSLLKELEALGLRFTGIRCADVEMWVFGAEFYWFGLPDDASPEERAEFIDWVKRSLGIHPDVKRGAH